MQSILIWKLKQKISLPKKIDNMNCKSQKLFVTTKIKFVILINWLRRLNHRSSFEQKVTPRLEWKSNLLQTQARNWSCIWIHIYEKSNSCIFRFIEQILTFSCNNNQTDSYHWWIYSLEPVPIPLLIVTSWERKIQCYIRQSYNIIKIYMYTNMVIVDHK